MKEQFDSPTQQSLFNSEFNNPTTKADDFMSGLSRAFTLAGGGHFVSRERLRTPTAVALFVNGQGVSFEVRVTCLREYTTD